MTAPTDRRAETNFPGSTFRDVRDAMAAKTQSLLWADERDESYWDQFSKDDA